LPCFLPFGNAGGLQILCCQGFEVKYYDFTLDALTLKPSDVCNVGVKSFFSLKEIGPGAPRSVQDAQAFPMMRFGDDLRTFIEPLFCLASSESKITGCVAPFYSGHGQSLCVQKSKIRDGKSNNSFKILSSLFVFVQFLIPRVSHHHLLLNPGTDLLTQ